MDDPQRLASNIMAATSQAIEVCALSWGDKRGYVVLSLRNPNLSNNDPGYWQDHPFRWPDDRDKIQAFIERKAHGPRDLYWAPAVFRTPHRDETKVRRLDALFADLDEVDPQQLPRHLKPTASWETSPGRYQALWSLDKQLAPAAHREMNQRLTYAIGADKGGWGLTKVLRLPGTENHKYPERPLVTLIHMNGHRLSTSQVLNDLPEVTRDNGIRRATERPDEDNLPSPRSVLQTHRISARAKRILASRHVVAHTRSERLWELECLLAESGLTAPEIVALVRESVWNKFRGRHDEIRRLFTEANKAIEHAGVEPAEELDEEHGAIEPDETDLQSWRDFDRVRQPISWLVAQVWGESEVGFISGPPKTYKSWLSLDMAISVATGTNFLNNFQTRRSNVLLIQEEDPRPVLQTRMAMIAGAKNYLYADQLNNGLIEMRYELPDNLYVLSNRGFTIVEEWLDQLQQWVFDHEIRLIIMDPLSMIAGEVDEFKMFELMAQLLKPLKTLREETQAAICIIHHHTKNETGKVGGAAMYGSVAFWAWEEAAMHLTLSGKNRVSIERFSKHEQLHPITVDFGDIANEWSPQVTQGSSGSLEDLMAMGDAYTQDELAAGSGLGRDAVKRHLDRLMKDGRVYEDGTRNMGRGRPATLYRMVRGGDDEST